MPETSIIIRTYNEEKHLGNLLRALETQDYRNYEVIIVDSSSSDKTVEIAEGFGVKVISIDRKDFTFGYSLNLGCQASQGKYLVFASAHVLPVNNSWLTNLVKPFADEKVAMVYGRQKGDGRSKFSEKRDFKRLFGNTQQNYSAPLDYANNANSAVRRDLWEQRKFDEYLFGLEDIDWAREMSAKGYTIRYEPKAAIYHIHDEEWHQVFNRYRREAIAAVRIGLSHPPQARITYFWFAVQLIADFFTSFPNWSLKRLEEILRFRYYQWKGSRTGWRQGRSLNIAKDKDDVFAPINNQSVIIKDQHQAEFQEVPLREMKPSDVLLKVDYVGICRTDLEVLEGALGYYRDGAANYPIVPGHEFSATVVRVGSNNKYQEWFRPGDKVVGECILARGEPKERKEVGVINYNGAYSRYIVMPGDAIHHLPAGLDPRTAVLTEPLAVVLRAIRRIRNRLFPGITIAVTGAGPIGNLCAQALSLEGYRVTVFDKNADRLKLLESRIEGTSTVLEDLNKFAVIIEATGSKEVLERVIKESRNDATILLLGFPYGDINYNFEDLVGSEKVFAGSVGGDREDFPQALKLLPKLDVTPFTQAIMPLEDFAKAWELHRTSKYLKVMLQP